MNGTDSLEETERKGTEMVRFCDKNLFHTLEACCSHCPLKCKFDLFIFVGKYLSMSC